MDRTVHPPSNHVSKGLKSAAIIFAAVVCVGVGILISSSLDLSPESVAKSPSVNGTLGVYPVVARDDGEYESPFVAVVEQVQNAVVNISARSQDQSLPWWHQRAGLMTSSGSGFFFREDGYVLTNNHVVQGAQGLTVRTATGFEYDAKLVGADPETDLAVLKVEPEHDVTVIPFGDSDNLKVGDWAIAIGNPFPQQGLDRTVTVGVISAIGRSQLNFGRETPEYQYYIQTDASINPGNSGGPLLNLRGECVGVNAAISSPTGGSVGIGFAIPINLARAVVPDLIETGKPQRGWLGVWLANVSEREAKRQGLDAVRGVVIDSVLANSPAERAGIKSGDIVLKFNGQDVNNASQLSVLVSTVRGGDPVEMELLREGSRQTARAVIANRDQFLAADESGGGGQSNQFQWMGMELLTFTPEIAMAMSTDHVPGVYVSRVYPNSPADQASITRGTIILQVNNESVKSLSDVERIVGQLRGTTQRIPLMVQEPDGSLARKALRP